MAFTLPKINLPKPPQLPPLDAATLARLVQTLPTSAQNPPIPTPPPLTLPPPPGLVSGIPQMEGTNAGDTNAAPYDFSRFPVPFAENGKVPLLPPVLPSHASAYRAANTAPTAPTLTPRNFPVVSPPVMATVPDAPVRNLQGEARNTFLGGLAAALGGGAEGFAAFTGGAQNANAAIAQNNNAVYQQKAKQADDDYKAQLNTYNSSVRKLTEDRLIANGEDSAKIGSYRAAQTQYNDGLTQAENEDKADALAKHQGETAALDKAKAASAWWSSLAQMSPEAQKAVVQHAFDSGQLDTLGIKIARKDDGTFDLPDMKTAAAAAQETARQAAEKAAQAKQTNANLQAKLTQAYALFKNPQTSDNGRNAAAQTIFQIEGQLGVADAKPLRADAIANMTVFQARQLSLAEKRYQLSVQEEASREKTRQLQNARIVSRVGNDPQKMAQAVEQIRRSMAVVDNQIGTVRQKGAGMTTADTARLQSLHGEKQALLNRAALLKQSAGPNAAPLFAQPPAENLGPDMGDEGRPNTAGRVQLVPGSAPMTSLPPYVQQNLRKVQGRGLDFEVGIAGNHTENGVTQLIIRPTGTVGNRWPDADAQANMGTFQSLGGQPVGWSEKYNGYLVNYTAPAGTNRGNNRVYDAAPPARPAAAKSAPASGRSGTTKSGRSFTLLPQGGK